MGKSTISMAIFYSYVSSPEGILNYHRSSIGRIPKWPNLAGSPRSPEKQILFSWHFFWSSWIIDPQSFRRYIMIYRFYRISQCNVMICHVMFIFCWDPFKHHFLEITSNHGPRDSGFLRIRGCRPSWRSCQPERQVLWEIHVGSCGEWSELW